jgi:hypothetical protein
MKNLIRIVLCVIFAFSVAFAQTATIKTVPMSPRLLGTMAPGTFPVYSGNHTIAKHMKVYLTADTTGTVSSLTWTLASKPAGSSTTLSSTSDKDITFVPDTSGWYYISLSVDGSFADEDTFYVSNYVGITTTTDCAPCHYQAKDKKFDQWKLTPHANVFKEGITGELEVAPVNGQMMGVYSVDRCAKCHTTGWDQTANNNNFGYVAHQNGFDTAWASTFTLDNGEYLIPQGDQTAWNLLNSAGYNAALPTATIGCESCHGPAEGHRSTADPTKISVSLDAGVCLQCHDAPTHHTIGEYFVTSVHANLPNGEHTARTSCFPCHSGAAYVKYAKNQANPGWTNADGDVPISCAVCHDPHNPDNFGLRIASNITLANGFSVTAGGNGQMCMRCHQARKDGQTAITDVAPYYGFTAHFGPHHGPQTDMLFGQGAYQYGDTTITGLMTHGAVVKDACVTCHMANIGTGMSPSHQWSMIDTTGGTPHDLVGACVTCHGPITSFDDIKASSDWDGNGKIEGVQTEVEGLTNILESYLPKDASGAVLTTAADAADSAKIKDQPDIIKGIYTYEYVVSDASKGVHNTKYTVAILQAALAKLGWVVPVELTSFQAQANGNEVTLNWETVSETNNKGFAIERKTAGSWESIGFVNGQGTTTKLAKYSFVDKLENIGGSTVYYRLKQVDLDGTFKYSKEVNVEFTNGPSKYTLAQNYPNPFNPTTTINFTLPYESNVKIVVYNVTGEVVKVLVNGTQSAGTHQVVLNSNSQGIEMSSGVYFYQIDAVSKDGAKNFRQTKKMVLLK